MNAPNYEFKEPAKLAQRKRFGWKIPPSFIIVPVLMGLSFFMGREYQNYVIRYRLQQFGQALQEAAAEVFQGEDGGQTTEH